LIKELPSLKINSKNSEKSMVGSNEIPFVESFRIGVYFCWDFFRCKSSTPQKINMEHINHPFRKENHLPNHHFQFPC